MVPKFTNKKRGVFAYISVEAPTTIEVAGTYYPIQGTFVNSPLEQFILTQDPAIQYIDSKTEYYKIHISATVKSNHTSCTIKVAIKKNTDVFAGSIMGTLCKTSGDLYNIAGTCVVELAYGDKIQLVCTADGNNDILTFSYFTTTINEFYIY